MKWPFARLARGLNYMIPKSIMAANFAGDISDGRLEPPESESTRAGAPSVTNLPHIFQST
jgi:hypothetical protein